MESFLPLQIDLDGDNAWPDLQGKEYKSGMMTHIAALPSGMVSGKPSIAIRGKLDNGEEVILQTSWNLLYSAARAIEARYGGAI